MGSSYLGGYQWLTPCISEVKRSLLGYPIERDATSKRLSMIYLVLAKLKLKNKIKN